MLKFVNTFKKNPLRALAQGYTFFIVFLFSCKGVLLLLDPLLFELNFLANCSRLYLCRSLIFHAPYYACSLD